MAELGKYTLVKVDNTVIAAQMDSQLSFETSILETTEISGSNRFKTFVYDEKEGNCSLSVQKSDTVEGAFYNAWYNNQVVTVWYGGVNVGEKYYLFSALITSISKSDPSTGISMLNIALKPTGIIQRLTVADEGGQTWTLSITTTGNGTVAATPSKANYDDGENVELIHTAALDWVFWKHKIGTSFSNTNPLNLLMDANKSIEYIFGFKVLDYTFDVDSENNWELINSPFTTIFSDENGCVIDATAVPSQYFYVPIMQMNLNQLFFNPIVFNRIRVWFDSTNFNFYVNVQNGEDGSTASTGEITAIGEPVFTKTFTELKYGTNIVIQSSIFNTTSATLKITRIVLDII